jgi:hypothetical protein
MTQNAIPPATIQNGLNGGHGVAKRLGNDGRRNRPVTVMELGDAFSDHCNVGQWKANVGIARDVPWHRDDPLCSVLSAAQPSDWLTD